MKPKSKTNIEKYNAPALSKGLDILELLATKSEGMKKSEIATELQRSVSEIFRMLAVLTDRGYLGIDPLSEKYTLALKMFELAHRNPPIKRLTNVAAHLMADLAVRLNQSVHLAILYGSNILVIAQNDPPGNNVTSVRLGARVPITLTASGAALISQMPKHRRVEICAEVEFATIDQKRIFEENIHQVVTNGVCISSSMVIAGVQNISVPIFDYSGLVVASLTIPYIQRLISTNDPDLDQAKKALAETGNSISAQLGVGVNTA